MNETEFFRPLELSSNVITFTEPTPSSWILTEKLVDKNNQLDAREYEERVGISYATGVFLCEGSEKPGEKAIVKIFKQVPYQGSEWFSRHQRSEQAREKPSEWSDAHVETKALQLLTQNHCESAPRVLGYKKEKQDHHDLLPGGFIVYLLMSRAPGIPLGGRLVRDTNDAFWKLSPATRHTIRQEFKLAWTNCVSAGVRPGQAQLGHIFWDQITEKVCLISFSTSDESNPDDEWSDYEWIGWGLAIPDEEYIWWTDTQAPLDISRLML